VSSPLQMNPVGPTVLFGYEPNLGIFAGFDIDFHRQFTAGSPSVQVSLKTLHSALQNGLAFGRKDNKEVTVGFRADQFMAYVRNSSELHSEGKNQATFEALKEAVTVDQRERRRILTLPRNRQRIVQEVSRLSRSACFRQMVLDAYSHRCAVTRSQLRLVEAAHILPVAAPESTDVVGNGIALSPTFHVAFDQGLIYLDESLTMRINPRKESDLMRLGLSAGLGSFKEMLGSVHLPADHNQWPDKKMIRLANKYRLIPSVK
ncbi:MAG: HNH endonuclease, partial [Candidatus Micrarchaeota archaeon]